jgi:hypothetical protein
MKRCESYFFLLFLFFHGCTRAQKEDYFRTSGTIEHVIVINRPLAKLGDKPEIEVISKIWYRDSFAIEEILSIKTDIDAYNVETTQYLKQYYRFNDLRNKKIYRFKTFNDTSVCYKKYNFAAKVEIEAGWGFNRTRKLRYDEVSKKLGDTIIDKVVYMRYLLTTYDKKKNKYHQVIFFRCDKNIEPFTYDLELSKKFGCPVVREYYYSDSTMRYCTTYSEIKFTSNILTTAENKIFDAWCKYAKEHPAK